MMMNTLQDVHCLQDSLLAHALVQDAPLAPEQLRTLEILLTSQRSRLTHFIRKHLRKDDWVDDVLQQTHLAAFRNWSRFRGESKPETWLFGIALNLVKNFRYRDDSHRFCQDDCEDEINNLPCNSELEPEQAALQRERIDLLRGAIEHLPLKMQRVVQLVLLEGLSYQDAAVELDLPIGTVRSRLSRARDALREEMERAELPPEKTH
ncbi:RNA polymerase sigma factor [Limnobacter humi]|uniref:RNA polymerase sigma factor n=1 Tax=Limnobacter humi TaxID=1778671 RepID=A0ABT1WHA7_9BURK|nr:RNA polymerase sigma factor [Limnobacter humi]MCQ8895824.1 RNA polymerase sigma factor [Limnobacter humi]